jgi:hypothetical protein
MHGSKEICIKVLIEKPEGKMPFRRSRHGWEGNMKMDIKEIGWENMDCVYLAHDREQRWAVVSMIMNFQGPWNN